MTGIPENVDARQEMSHHLMDGSNKYVDKYCRYSHPFNLTHHDYDEDVPNDPGYQDDREGDGDEVEGESPDHLVLQAQLHVAAVVGSLQQLHDLDHVLLRIHHYSWRLAIMNRESIRSSVNKSKERVTGDRTQDMTVRWDGD